jgi:hypothetical protein
VPEPTPSLNEFSLAGTIYDTIRRPLSDVLIQVVEGPRMGASSVSDLAGHYELPGPFVGAVVLKAEKPGFTPVTIHHRSAVSGPSHRDIFLPSPETVELAGLWSVTLAATASCKEIPEAIRTRLYMAHPIGLQYRPHAFDVRLGSDTLFRHWTNTIVASVSGTDASFEIPAWDWGVGIAEDLGQSRQLFIWGEGAGSVSPSSMVGILTGGFEYTDYSGQAPVTVTCDSFQLRGVRQ